MLRSRLVNCSTDVYQDKKAWRQSRNKIDDEIHRLRQKIEDLKEIRRHLKQKRPQAETDEALDDEMDENKTSTTTTTENTDTLNFNNLNTFDFDSIVNLTDDTSKVVDTNVSLETTTVKSRGRHRNNQEERRKIVPEVAEVPRVVTRRKYRPQNVSELSNTTLQIDVFVTNSTSRPVTFTNHHRHHHRIQLTGSTTTEYQPSTGTESMDVVAASTTEATRISTSETPNRINYRVSN